MKQKILSRGAEAILILKNNLVIKERKAKSYRIPEIDEKLRVSRTKKESRLLQRAIKIIPVPKVISSNKYEISLELIKGKKLSESLDKLKNKTKIAEEIGKNIAKLHDAGIIHGDLTTSNMIWSKNKLFFIDFGLSYDSQRIEDKAVDLHLIKEALEARHHKASAYLWTNITKGYKISKNYLAVLKQLEKVESRGRYKEQY